MLRHSHPRVASGHASSLLLAIGFLNYTTGPSAATAQEKAGAWKSYFLEEAVQSKNAVCLDGSAPVYWHSHGYGDGVHRWLIFHEGGGWCNSLQDCLDRALDRGWAKALGSSTHESEQFFPPEDAWKGLLNRNTEGNSMANWNYVFIRYCDGFSFAGHVEQPIQVNDPVSGQPFKLHFRGHAISEAIMDDLVGEPSKVGADWQRVTWNATLSEKFGFPPLTRATEVVIAGSSAGGLAVMMQCDHWADRIAMVNPWVSVRCIADSAWFQIPEIATEEYSALMALDPASRGMPQGFMAFNDLWRRLSTMHSGTGAGFNDRCVAAQPIGELWRCSVASIAAKYVTTPLLVTQSQFDTWQLNFIAGCKPPDCTPDIPNTWGVGVRVSIKKWLKTDVSAARGHAAFLDACLRHGGTRDPAPWRIAATSRSFGARRRQHSSVVTATEAIDSWRNGDSGGASMWTELGTYPCEECCEPERTPISSIAPGTLADALSASLKKLGISLKLSLVIAAGVGLLFLCCCARAIFRWSSSAFQTPRSNISRTQYLVATDVSRERVDRALE